LNDVEYQSLFALNIIKSCKMIEVNQEFILPTYPAKGGQAFGKD